MVGPWMHPGRRRSVAFLQRIRSHQPLKKRSVPRSVKPDTLIPMDRFNDPLTLSEISTSARMWRSQEFDGLESFWGQNLKNEQSETAETMAPLVIRNPVHSRKLEEPIERKREYWSENLLYIMRREGLIPKNRPVVMDRPTPEEPYRLSANVVRLLEQEPQLYIAKSSIKTPSFDSEISERTASDSIESWDNKPFPHSRASYGVARKTFDDSCHRSSHKCCDCGRSRTLNSFSGAEDFGRKAHSLTSLSEFKSRHPLYGQLRHYSATAARIPAEKIPKDRVAFDWDPVNYIPLRGRHVGSDEISQAISKLWIERRQKSRTFEHRLRMKRYLETRVFNELLFTMTGSSANGFGFDDSDVDMCVEYKSNILPLARGSQVTVLKKMQAHMIGMQCFRKPTIIPAICPLLKFTYKQRSPISIVVEINASGNVGIRNTQLLYSYSRMDARVAPLVGACKHWATTMHIKDAQRGFLSSYSLTLMVIYFLQKMGVLPVLHQLVPEFETGRGFERNEKLLLPKWSSPNSQDVGSLFQNMLKFYCDFDFQENCISVREGASMGLEEAIENDPDIALSSKYTSRQMWGLVNIQEPFNFTNTARAVRHKANLKQMKKALKLSSELLHRKGAIDRLFGTSAPDKKTEIEKGP